MNLQHIWAIFENSHLEHMPHEQNPDKTDHDYTLVFTF